MNYTDLDVMTPEEVPAVLRATADKYNESASELQATWGYPNAGKVWSAYAVILERAAKSCEAANRKYV